MRIDGINAFQPRQVLPTLDAAVSMANITAKVLQQATETAKTAANPQIEAPVQQQVPATPQQNLGSLSMLVALSSLTPSDERKRTQLSQARKGLDGLDKLHREMLSGQTNKTTLNALQEWLKEMPESDDEKLAQFFKDIELRVRVELAKFDFEA